MSTKSTWKNNADIKLELEKLHRCGVTHMDKLRILNRKFGLNYKSVTTIRRMLEYFEIQRFDEIPLLTLKKLVAEMLPTSGNYGYRAITTRLATEYQIKVPRDLVYDVLTDLDHEGLKQRRPGTKQKKKKGTFSSDGPSYLMSIDGHDKLKGFQNWIYPVAIYGAIDTYSRKILFLKALRTNNCPTSVAFCYLQYFKEGGKLPKFVRMDGGTETGKLCELHALLTTYLRPDVEDATDLLIVGPSTENKIERLWLDVRKKVVDPFKEVFVELKNSNNYNPSDLSDRDILSYAFFPLVQKELDAFSDYWNNHRIRNQKERHPYKILPDGIPNVLYENPDEDEGFKDYGLALSHELIERAQNVINLPNELGHVLAEDTKRVCEIILPMPSSINTPREAANAYLMLKRRLQT